MNTAHANPWVNCEDAISAGLSPAAAAIAAKLALGSEAAPCSAAESPGAATITWPVPKLVAMDEGAWVTMVWACVPALLSVVVEWLLVWDVLKDGELVAVETTGAVEMTDAVFVAPTVVPCWRQKKKLKWICNQHLPLGIHACTKWIVHTHTCERQIGDAGVGERHHWVYSQSGGCGNSWAAIKACCAGHLGKRRTIIF